MKLFILQILALWSPCSVNELLLLFMTSQLFLVLHFKFGWLVCAFYSCMMVCYTVSKSYYLNLHLFMDFLEIPLWSGTTGLVFTTEGCIPGASWRTCCLSSKNYGGELLRMMFKNWDKKAELWIQKYYRLNTSWSSRAADLLFQDMKVLYENSALEFSMLFWHCHGICWEDTL